MFCAACANSSGVTVIVALVAPATHKTEHSDLGLRRTRGQRHAPAGIVTTLLPLMQLPDSCTNAGAETVSAMANCVARESSSWSGCAALEVNARCSADSDSVPEGREAGDQQRGKLGTLSATLGRGTSVPGSSVSTAFRTRRRPAAVALVEAMENMMRVLAGLLVGLAA